MTAFARCSTEAKWGSATWEIRAVNQRYLDCSLKLPEAVRHLEPKLREIATKYLNRGRIDCFLRYQLQDTATKVSVNTSMVNQLIQASAKIAKQCDVALAAINPLQILSWNNVLHVTETEKKGLDTHVLKLFDKTLHDLVKSRKQEGSALQKILLQKLEDLTHETTKIYKQSPIVIKRKREQILVHLSEVQDLLDPNRLEQEMLFFAQKIDITEEVDRLNAHVTEVTRILKEGGVAGKRLDFLMQELNREANTIASKSTDQTITHAAIELKVIIEQMREQVQNIE